MGKIYVIIGKSASGKDTVYTRLLKDPRVNLKPYVIHTTRPMREGETDGVEYHFSDVSVLEKAGKEGNLIESRVYHTVYGDWYYFTIDDSNIDIEKNNYLYIGTLESYIRMRSHYGATAVLPIYIEVDDGIRLKRAIEREEKRKNPGYAEICRRFLADEEDFSEANLKKAGVETRFDNRLVEDCMENIISFML